jgi:ribosomal protein L1
MENNVHYHSRMATVGDTSMSVTQLVQNITASVEQIVSSLPGGADNIRNLYIKTEDSMALPLYVSQGMCLLCAFRNIVDAAMSAKF